MSETADGAALWALVIAEGSSQGDLGRLLAVVRSARERGIIRGAIVVIPTDREDLLDLVSHAGLLPLLEPKANLAAGVRLGLDFLADPGLEPPAAAVVILLGDGWTTTETLARLAARWREGGAAAFRPEAPVGEGSGDRPPPPLLLDRSAWPLLSRLQGARTSRALRGGGFPALTVPG